MKKLKALLLSPPPHPASLWIERQSTAKLPLPFHQTSLTIHQYPFLLLVERSILRVKCFAQAHNTMTQPGLKSNPPNPESSVPTIGPLHTTWTHVYSHQWLADWLRYFFLSHWKLKKEVWLIGTQSTIRPGYAVHRNIFIFLASCRLLHFLENWRGKNSFWQVHFILYTWQPLKLYGLWYWPLPFFAA